MRTIVFQGRHQSKRAKPFNALPVDPTAETTLAFSAEMTTPTDHDLPALHATPEGLYRHYKGGWYEVIDTVRCSETLGGMTLYRALYGAFGQWVRPSKMFNETGDFEGKHQLRFSPRDPAQVQMLDLGTAQAIIFHLRSLARRTFGIVNLDAALRPPPPEPKACCGRGCNGCVWEGYYEALHHWRNDALALMHKAES